MWEGGGGQDGVEWGGKWDNCNSIINKYILKNLNLLGWPKSLFGFFCMMALVALSCL